MLKRFLAATLGRYRSWLARLVARSDGTFEGLRQAASTLEASPRIREPQQALPEAFAQRDIGDAFVIHACVAADRRTAVLWATSLAFGPHRGTVHRRDA